MVPLHDDGCCPETTLPSQAVHVHYSPPPPPLYPLLLAGSRFNACSLEGEEQFMLMGLVLGLAIYNRVLLDFPLPLPLYKKLLSQPVGLRDLEEMQPMLGRSLRQLLHYDGPSSVEVSAGCSSDATLQNMACLQLWLL